MSVRWVMGFLLHGLLKLAIEYNIQLPTEDCAQICLYIAQMQAFSPVTEYLNACAERYPADEELLNSLAETYLGTDSELHCVFLRKTLISAVARAFIPGCKVDTVCILQGIQGCGKSTFWKILAGEDWFDDTVSSASDKDERLKLHQSWFIEWAELEAIFKRKDISAVKAFITTQTDQVRPPYGRDILEMQRPSIIVGSTNESDFLADPTGNRRYWVIPVQHAEIPLAQLAEERDRLWAAAVHAFKSGETWTLPAELRTVARLESVDYVYSDPWEAIILDYCSGSTEITTVEILTNALQLEIHQMDKRAEMRVTTLLKQNGWRSARGRHRGVQIRVWKNPKFEEMVVTGCHSTEVVQEKVRSSKDLGGVTTSETTPVTTPRDNPP